MNTPNFKLKPILFLVTTMSMSSVVLADTTFIQDDQIKLYTEIEQHSNLKEYHDLNSKSSTRTESFGNVSFIYDDNEGVTVPSTVENASVTHQNDTHIEQNTTPIDVNKVNRTKNTNSISKTSQNDSIKLYTEVNPNKINGNDDGIQEQNNFLKQHNAANQLNIQNARIVGLNHVSQEQISNIIKLQEIKQLENQEMAVAQIEHRLNESGYFKNVAVHYEPNYGYLEIHLVENPVISNVKVNGAKTIQASVIEDNLTRYHLGKGSPLNPPLLQEYLNTLQTEYHAQGKESAQVKLTPMLQSDNTIDLSINIEEGPTTKIHHITFHGNESISDRQLKRVIGSNERGFFSRIVTNNPLNSYILKDDVEKIINYYHNQGYLMAQVKDVRFADATEQNNKPSRDVDFYIEEGSKYYFVTPKFNFDTNEESLPVIQELVNKLHTDKQFLSIQTGNLYRKDDVVKLNQRITQFLANRGYAFNKIDINFEPIPANDENKAELNQVLFTFDVKAGQQIQIRNINVSGNQKTRQNVILREMRQSNGDVFDLSKIQRSKERLDLTGYFNDVDITTEPVEGHPELVDINVQVKERRTGTMQFAVGYIQDFGLTLNAGVEDRNIFGTGKHVRSQINWNKVQRNFEVGYSDPFFTKNGTSLDASIYGSLYDPREQKGSYQQYRTTKYGASVNFGLPLNEYDKLYIGGIIENFTLNTYENAPLRYRQFIQAHNNGQDSNRFNGVIAKATIGWGRNTTNHAYWPTNGYITNVNAEVTIPGSKLTYYKFNASNKFFIPIGKESAVILNGNIGYANSFGKTNQLPFFENYYAGGLGTVRGFENGTLGPKVYDRNNNIVSYGGNKFISFGAEFQTPLPFVKDSSNVRLGAFIDAGSTWDGRNYTARDSDNGVSVYGQNHHSTFRNELRASAGVSYTWLSPIGPVKFSYSIPLNRKDSDQVQRFQFQLGTTF